MSFVAHDILSDADKRKERAQKAELAKKEAEKESKADIEKENLEKGAGDLGSDTPRDTTAIAPTVASTNDDNSSVSGPTGLSTRMSHLPSSETPVNGLSTAASPLPGGEATPDSADLPNTPNSSASGDKGSDFPKIDSPFSGTNHSQIGYGLTPSHQTDDKIVNVENGKGGVEGTKNLNKRNFDSDLPAHEWGDDSVDENSEKVERVHSAGVHVSPTKKRLTGNEH